MYAAPSSPRQAKFLAELNSQPLQRRSLALPERAVPLAQRAPPHSWRIARLTDRNRREQATVGLGLNEGGTQANLDRRFLDGQELAVLRRRRIGASLAHRHRFMSSMDTCTPSGAWSIPAMSRMDFVFFRWSMSRAARA